MKIDDLFDDTFCDCTPRNANKCPLCQKPLPYVDSPFGAIPSLKAFERFLQKFTESFDKFQFYVKNSVEKDLEPIKEQYRINVESLLAQIKFEIEKQKSELLVKASEYQVKTQELMTTLEEKADKDLNAIGQKEKELRGFIDRIYRGLTESLNFLMKNQTVIFNLIQDFQVARVAYVEILLPKIEKLMEKVNIITKFMPKTDIDSIGIEIETDTKLFDVENRFYTAKALARQKEEFQLVWDRISLLDNPLNSQEINDIADPASPVKENTEG